MTVQQFIEKAIEGGWDIRKGIGLPDGMNISPSLESAAAGPLLHRILLDPLAWQAEGKVEGWQERCMDCDGDVVRRETPEYPNLPNGLSWCPNRCPAKRFMQGWHHKMHLMITALAEGKTLEQYLETL